ncbi:MAG: FkbM family methyltransferase [Spirosomataceae bacterium]
MKELKKIVWDVLNFLKIGGSVQLYLESALRQNGWFESYHRKRSIDAVGTPLPWCTYSFIAFLTPRLKPHFEVFEYGSGNSTRWYAAHTELVQAVEHDEAWVKEVTQQLPPNASVIYKALGKEYVEAVALGKKKYHLVVVDGRQRVNCSRFAVDFLSPDGVLVLDNSERDNYQEIRVLMKEKGFRWIDFYGMAPIISRETCTTIFYRDFNCLGI